MYADHHQFLIVDLEGGTLVSQLDAQRLLVSFHPQDSPDVLSLTTGTQAGDVEVSASAHASAPPLPGGEWEDVIELSVRCASGLAVAPLMDAPVLTLVRGGGEYRVRLSARGRDLGVAREYAVDEDGEPIDDASTVEHYLIQAWPEPMRAPIAHQLTSTFAERQAHGPVTVEPVSEEEAGLAGGRAIGAALDHLAHTHRSGDLGGLHVSAALTGTRSRLFPVVALTCGCFGDYDYIGDARLVIGGETWIGAHRTVEEGGDRLTGETAQLVLTLQTLDRPKSATVGWNWWVPINPGDLTAHKRTRFPVLVEDSVVTLTFRQHENVDGITRSTVDVTHDGLPNEWLASMDAWWRWRLALAEQRQIGTR